MSLVDWANSMWRKVTGGARMVTPAEVVRALRLPVLGIIPHIERRRRASPAPGAVTRRMDLEGRWRSRLLIHFAEQAPASVAYAGLVKELQARSRSHQQKVWLFGSSVAGEGTSLSCMNLAICAQRQGILTLLVEGHTRSPRVSRVFRLDLDPGLTGCLTGSLNAADAIRRSDMAGVDVLPAGRAVPYPETLWAMPAFLRVLSEVRSLYDLVLFDGPPVLQYPDASVLANKMDGIVLVHQFGRTAPQRVEKVLAKLADHRERVIGVLLNDVPLNTSG